MMLEPETVVGETVATSRTRPYLAVQFENYHYFLHKVKKKSMRRRRRRKPLMIGHNIVRQPMIVNLSQLGLDL